MDEHIVLRRGNVQRIQGDLIHDIPKDLTEWTAKHNWYASRECQDITSHATGADLHGQAGAKRWIKQNAYLRLPLFYRAFLYWFYRYFIRFGFLDGTQGLVYHFLQAFWYRFLVDSKLYEAQSAITLLCARKPCNQPICPWRWTIKRPLPPMYKEYRFNGASQIHSHTYLSAPIRSALGSLRDGARVLDIGCGNGSLTAAWSKSTWDTAGIDLSESGISHATASYPGISFLKMPIGHELVSRFGEEKFDAVVSAEVIEHLYSPRDLTQCAFRLLKPGGMLILTTPYNGYLKNLAIAAIGDMDRHWTALWDGGHIKFWSWKTIRSLLAEAGFITPEFQGAGRFPFLWKSMVVRVWKPGVGSPIVNL